LLRIVGARAHHVCTITCVNGDRLLQLLSCDKKNNSLGPGHWHIAGVREHFDAPRSFPQHDAPFNLVSVSRRARALSNPLSDQCICSNRINLSYSLKKICSVERDRECRHDRANARQRETADRLRSTIGSPSRARRAPTFRQSAPKEHARFSASGTGGRCNPSPSQPHGTRVRSLKGWDPP